MSNEAKNIVVEKDAQIAVLKDDLKIAKENLKEFQTEFKTMMDDYTRKVTAFVEDENKRPAKGKGKVLNEMIKIFNDSIYRREHIKIKALVDKDGRIEENIN